ncbi:MAG TPA: NAD(P)/FAD-dependent oxidoreductase [Acetobacteraceae bacterium]|nr:NAD(P)/FAD-dependent oxidoreductase [Acetobacteraceae bacterium]
MVRSGTEAAEACDVLVIGGGPAGSTAAALLARQGRDVVLLEQAAHPRFHIGESLLPRNLAIFERLGLRDAIHALGVLKPGAEMVSDATGRCVDFDFATGIDRSFTYSYQVRRSAFDALLFANAERQGVRAMQRTRVVQVDGLAAGQAAQVLAEQPDGTMLRFAPRFLLDASGRDTFLAGRMQMKQADKSNNTAAVYAHFHDVPGRDGAMAGCISIHLAEDGWFWVIPLQDGVTSVGFVGTQAAFRRRSGTPAELLQARIQASRMLGPRMAHARLASEVMTAANYSYRARSGWGEGYMLIGDAFGFVDPVFSSGVLLAMTGGTLGADVAHAWLDNAAEGRRLARQAERQLRRSMDHLGWLIYRINNPVIRQMLMTPNNVFRMRDGMVSLLAGNFDGRVSLRLPLLLFKGVYHLASLGARFGLPVVETAN